MDLHEVTRRRLEERLTQLTRRLDKVTGDRRREQNPLDPDWEEQAITRQNDEVLDGLDAEGRRELEVIRASLNRLANGTYGTCMSCDKPIAPARLEALPYAVHCIACASKAESQRS